MRIELIKRTVGGNDPTYYFEISCLTPLALNLNDIIEYRQIPKAEFRKHLKHFVWVNSQSDKPSYNIIKKKWTVNRSGVIFNFETYIISPKWILNNQV